MWPQASILTSETRIERDRDLRVHTHTHHSVLENEKYKNSSCTPLGKNKIFREIKNVNTPWCLSQQGYFEKV